MIFGRSDQRGSPANTPELPSLDATQLHAALGTAQTNGGPLPRRAWHPKAGGRGSQHRRTSDKSDKSQQSSKSGKSNKSKGGESRKSSKLRRLPPVDLSTPLSRLTEALDLAPLSLAAPSTKERRANKAALALRTLILDPPAADTPTVTLAAIPPFLPKQKGTKGRKSAHLPQLREKDVDRLRTQLLKPDEAKMVMASARALYVDKPNATVERAVCLDCSEFQADILIVEAKRIEHARQLKERHFDNHRFSTLKAKSAPPPPPRLPVLLSLFQEIGAGAGRALPAMMGSDPTLMTFGLFEPASAMSLHRPLAGALPSADTLRRGFDALINAESKIYLYEGPSHKNIHPPTDRISVYTYWWGFELALPPPTLQYLGRAKSIATSVLNLLSVIVYAVPGGTRELAPFVGVLSRYIENEWLLLKSQDRGKGVVCGATWFIPAALTARPWDFGEDTIRDHPDIPETEHDTPIAILPSHPNSGGVAIPTKPHADGPVMIPKDAVVKISGPKGEAEGVVLGIGRGLFGEEEGQTVAPNAEVDLDKGIEWKKEDGVLPVQTTPSINASLPAPDHPSPVIMTFSMPPPLPPRPAAAEATKPKAKRSPSLLSTSTFKRFKAKKASPAAIDTATGDTSVRSGASSPTTAASSGLPTPTDASFASNSSSTAASPIIGMPAIFSHTLTSRTVRLIKGTLGRKARGSKPVPWTEKGEEGISPDQVPSLKGRRAGSAFEIRRFLNRSM